MQPKDISSKMPCAKIFGSLSPEQTERIESASEIYTLSSGEDAEKKTRGSIAVLLKGRANVYSADESRKTLIRILGEGDVFGVAGLFSQSEDVSRVVARAGTQILLIPKSEIVSLISANEKFASDYISFLEKRIAFLNNRISSFTAGSCERKLALFLYSVSSEESFSFNVSFSSLAKQLDMGRASFYRALAILEEADLAIGNEKTISVKSRSALKAKYL